jgi:flavodoxin
MKKGIALLVAAALMLTGCGSSTASTGAAEPAEPANEVVEETQTEDQTEEGQAEETQTEEAGTEAGPAEQAEADGAEAAATTAGTETESSSDTLVIYFSRTGEQYVVGVIDKGNTAIVAEMIAEQTGADLFEVLPAEDHYPMTYDELTEVAKQEQNENARPAYSGELPDLSGYSTISIGAPVWWGDWPMIMYTVFENNDFSGKTLIPFSTHEGSGLSGFDKKLQDACPDATVGKGLAVQGNDAQNNQESVKETVGSWLAEIGY